MTTAPARAAAPARRRQLDDTVRAPCPIGGPKARSACHPCAAAQGLEDNTVSRLSPSKRPAPLSGGKGVSQHDGMGGALQACSQYPSAGVHPDGSSPLRARMRRRISSPSNPRRGLPVICDIRPPRKLRQQKPRQGSAGGMVCESKRGRHAGWECGKARRRVAGLATTRSPISTRRQQESGADILEDSKPSVEAPHPYPAGGRGGKPEGLSAGAPPHRRPSSTPAAPQRGSNWVSLAAEGPAGIGGNDRDGGKGQFGDVGDDAL